MTLLAATVVASCLLAAVFAGPACPPGETVIKDEAAIEALLLKWNATISKAQNAAVTADWDWASNLTDYNQRIKAAKNAELAAAFKDIWKVAICVDCADCNDTVKRTVSSYQTIDTSALPAEAYDEYFYMQATMEDIYGKAKVCRPISKGGECLPLDPDLTNIIGNSRDYCELQWAWDGWRNESGRRIRGYFTGYVHLLNEAARLNGFKSAKEMWTKSYWSDEPEFFGQMEAAWQQVKPLYQQLHAFARNRLRKLYSKIEFPKSGHIPAHILGNMWAQDWNSINELLVPDENATAIDITKLLKEKNINATDLYHMSDEFFQSIGMDPMTDTFWNKSILLKPDGVELVCHASAWDFYQWSDFRIKQCTEVTKSHFQTVHHEMGHIQYYMHYKEQPIEFRSGANPGFHEAIGDLIALSVMTPDHLKAVGLLPKDKVIDDGTYLNSMMTMALKKIVFLPFGYLIDKYRWDVFEKKTSFNDLNAAWWKVRCSMQGVSPPVKRSEDDFDPGAKYHVPASVPYDRYFFAHIVQFQLHISICKAMGITKDFHKCDIYKNPEAAAKLREAMKLGQSVPYPQVLKMITGTEKLDASALLEYFEPLRKFLVQANKDTNEEPGWKDECSEPPVGVCNYHPAPTTVPPAPTTVPPAPTTGCPVIITTPCPTLPTPAPVEETTTAKGEGAELCMSPLIAVILAVLSLMLL